MFNLFKKKIIVVTHSGSFHADDVFACATLSIWADQNNIDLKIERSRDPEVIKRADIVVDVGMEYEPEKRRFDHHQKGGAGEHKNAIPYASFGLVWKHYGEQICEPEVWQRVEDSLVVPIDARDNGVSIPFAGNIKDHRTGDAISNFNPTMAEEKKDLLEFFFEALDVAKKILTREIAIARSYTEGAKLTRVAIMDQNEPEILVLTKRFESEEEVSKHKNIKFIVTPSETSENWSVVSARSDIDDYKSNRVTFPRNWLGLRDLDLAEVSGVPDAIFCHSGGWLAKAGSREGALQMAKLALQSSQN